MATGLGSLCSGQDPGMDTISKTLRASAHHPSAHHPSQSRVSFLSASEDIVAVRDELDTWLRTQRPALDDMRVFDIVLAANELMCNAFEHGTSDEAIEGTSHRSCLVDIRWVISDLTITVTNGATNASLLPTPWWVMPDASQPNGRGLAIVKALADDVVLTVTHTSVSIAASFDLNAPTAPALARSAAVAV